MKERYCFICSKLLDLPSLICKNFHLSQDYLESLWQNSNIQFLCCECFKEEILYEKGILQCFDKKNEEFIHENILDK